MKNKQHPLKEKQTFKEAVASTPHTQNCYQAGLAALGKYSVKIELGDTMQCSGSLDIDTCVTNIYPQSNRWDYAFCYKGEVFFVEVHSANTSEVDSVMRKLQWLKDWLHLHAPQINMLKARSRTAYYWIQSGKFNIPKNYPQAIRARQAGITPISKLVLP